MLALAVIAANRYPTGSLYDLSRERSQELLQQAMDSARPGDSQVTALLATAKAWEHGGRRIGADPELAQEAVDAARRKMVNIPLTGGTIPHEVVGSHGAGKVLMKPAAPGAGVIAGGAVRAIMECAGISDILTKSLGSTNPHNMVRAAMNGLQLLTTVEQIARERGIEPSSLQYKSRATSRRAVEKV